MRLALVDPRYELQRLDVYLGFLLYHALSLAGRSLALARLDVKRAKEGPEKSRTLEISRSADRLALKGWEIELERLLAEIRKALGLLGNEGYLPSGG